MTARRAKTDSTAGQRWRNDGSATPTTLAQRVRPWLLFVLTALLVARPLLPSEGVSWVGDGQPFNLITIGLGSVVLLLATIEGGFVRRANLADASVAALVVLSIVAAQYSAQYRTPRVSVNMMFEWIALGFIFYMVRQLVRTPRESRALIAVMLSLAMTMTAYGFFQVAISLPATRAAYAENPDEVLQASGQWFPPDTPEREQFEKRLQSNEPLATFALTNSLAGFLLPWFVIATGIFLGTIGARFASGGERDGRRRIVAVAQLLAAVLCIVAMGACLVLTKSRSAYVAAACGLLLLPMLNADLRRAMLTRRVLVAGAVVLILLLVAAVLLGGLDREVLTEANKSLGYRFEYWEATLKMIGRYPWLGVGPGNFQDFYTRFKLPQASEEIRDPHNLFLEVWATMGTFALVALGQALAVLAWRTWNMNAAALEQAEAPAGDAPSDNTAGISAPRVAHQTKAARLANATPLILAGGIGGFFLAFLIGPGVGLAFSEQQLVGGLLVATATCALLWGWVNHGRLTPRLPALGVLVLVIHFLAAGGIAYPGVAGSFWLLFALALNTTSDAQATHAARRWRFAWVSACGFVLAVLTAMACYRFAYRPVLQCHAAMQRAADERLSTDARIALLLDAARADPLSAEPWWSIAQMEVARLGGNPLTLQSTRPLVDAIHKMLDLRPHSAAAWRQAGRWFHQMYIYDRQPATAKAAMVSFRRAVALYPNLPELRGEFALSLAESGDIEGAKSQARVARRLDKVTPHADKKLSPEVRQQLDELEQLEEQEPPEAAP